MSGITLFEEKENKTIVDIIPRDKFFDKRVRNLSKTVDKEIFYENGQVVSVVFVNKIGFFKFATWITKEGCTGRGYASRCLVELKKRHKLLLAKTQAGNILSYKFAENNNFKKLFYIPKILNLAPGTLFYWNK